MTDVTLDTTLNEIDQAIRQPPCYYCQTSLGCGCRPLDELYPPEDPFGARLGLPNGEKDPRCKCTCGECYAPWGEVLDDE